jgi:hypothetical protein
MGHLLTLEFLHIEGVPAVAHGGVGAGRVGVLLVVGVELAELVEAWRGVGVGACPVGVGALAPGQAGDLPQEGPGVVVGLHVLVAVVHQQVGVARLDRCRLLRASHAGLL